MVKISGRFEEGSGRDGRPTRAELLGERSTTLVVGYAAAIGGTLLWGTTFVALKLLLAELTPFAAQSVRFAIGGLAYLGLLVILGRGRLRPPRARRRLLLVAVFGPALNSLGVIFAVDLIGAGTSSLVIMLVPVLTGLLAVQAGYERFGLRKLIGFALALAGLAIVVLPGGPERSFATAGLLGLLVLLGGALGFAVYNVYARPLFAFYTPLEVSCYLGLLVPVALAPFLLFPGFREQFAAVPALSPTGWLLLGYVSLGGYVGAFLCWYVALRSLGSTRVALMSYLIPIWGLTGSALVLREPISVWLPLGVGLVVAGIVVASRSSPVPAPSTPAVAAPAAGKRD